MTDCHAAKQGFVAPGIKENVENSSFFCWCCFVLFATGCVRITDYSVDNLAPFPATCSQISIKSRSCFNQSNPPDWSPATASPVNPSTQSSRSPPVLFFSAPFSIRVITFEGGFIRAINGVNGIRIHMAACRLVALEWPRGLWLSSEREKKLRFSCRVSKLLDCFMVRIAIDILTQLVASWCDFARIILFFVWSEGALIKSIVGKVLQMFMASCQTPSRGLVRVSCWVLLCLYSFVITKRQDSSVFFRTVKAPSEFHSQQKTRHCGVYRKQAGDVQKSGRRVSKPCGGG